MAQVRKCEITGGKVTNIGVFDDENLPAWVTTWVDYAPTAVIGGTWDGSVFGPVPQADIDAAQGALLDRLTVEALENRATDQAQSELIMQIVRTLLTGNTDFFTSANGGAGVTDKASYKSMFREILESI